MPVAFLSHTHFLFGCLNIYFILDGDINHNTPSKRVNRRQETGISPQVKYFTDRSKAVPLLWIFYFFCLVFVMPL